MDKASQRELAKSVGKAIARRREQAGYTQEEVAEKLGLGRGAIARVEQGIAIPTIVRLVELADLFGCRLDELLIEASTRKDDQATLITQLLAPLNAADQRILLDWVKVFAQQFKGS
ncbi:helix-turn-helix domain-containing protein [Ralstonia syzygii]|uniref:Putative phage regulatory protein n=1 Tax=Ralstonia syzygii R24 TaxID=907261 RepID=G3A652_9RALS|nr:helix-turn-helix transcriptional regulator [Ralstonia syzygii]CCA85930.1 putative phage regulatory protein [Ralstonia syzygii R24]